MSTTPPPFTSPPSPKACWRIYLSILQYLFRIQLFIHTFENCFEAIVFNHWCTVSDTAFRFCKN